MGMRLLLSSLVCITLLLLLLLTVNGQDADNPLRLPLKYITTDEHSIDALAQAAFVATTSCQGLMSYTAEICVELPNNWQWNPFRGVVFFDVTNSSTPSQPFCTNSKAGDAVPCCSISSWPGGDMWVHANAGNYGPITMTVSVTMRPFQSHLPIVKPHFERTNKLSFPHLKDIPVTVLRPVIFYQDAIQVDFDQSAFLTMEVCVNTSSGNNFNIDSTILSETGTFTQYICTSKPCDNPDGTNIIGSVPYSYPVSILTTQLPTSLKRLFVTVYNAFGVLNSTTGKYSGSFRYVAQFYSAK